MKIEERFKRLDDPHNWRLSDDTSQSGRRRWLAQRRYIGLVAATVLLAAGVGWVLYGAFAQTGGKNGTSSAHRAGAIVPWRPIKSHAGEMRLTGLDAAPPPCAATALVATVQGGGGAGGTFYVPITVRNSSQAACTIKDEELSVHWDSTGHGAISGSAARVLFPGGSQLYRLGFVGSCVSVVPPPGGPAASVVQLAGAPLQTLGSGVPSSVATCVSAFMDASEPQTPEDAGTGPYSALHVNVDVPPSVVAGSKLLYTVSIENSAATDYHFGACPTYTETVGVEGLVNTSSYSLNCENVIVPAGGSRIFAMQADLPAGSGTAKVGWFMDDGPSSVTSTKIS